MMKRSCVIDAENTVVIGATSNTGSVGSSSRTAARTLLVIDRGSPDVRMTSAIVRDVWPLSVVSGTSGKYTVGEGGAASEESRASPTTPITVYHGPVGRLRKRLPSADAPVES